MVENLTRQKRLRLEWEAQEKLRKIREKEEWMKLDYYRRHNPKTKEDFELLYNALECKFGIGFPQNISFIVFCYYEKQVYRRQKGDSIILGRCLAMWSRMFKEMNNALNLRQ